MADSRFAVSIPLLSFMVAAYVGIVLNGAFWYGATSIRPLEGFGAWLFYIGLAVFLVCGYAFILNFIGLSFIAKPLFIFIILLSATLAYVMDVFGDNIDKAFLTNLLELGFAENKKFLDHALIYRVGIMGIFPALIVAKLRIGRKGFGQEFIRRFVFAAACLIVLILVFILQFSEMYDFFRINLHLSKLLNPFNFFSAIF